MTNRITKLLILAAGILFATVPAWSADFEKGAAAYLMGDYATALRELRPLAEQGYADAQFNLGVRYDNGQGVPQDYAEAVRWYRKAAEQGNAPAQFNLGVRYDNGQGVPQENAEAVRWYRKAAEQGVAQAQKNLGVMYGTGRGVPQNYVLGYMWFNLAAVEEDEGAIKGRDLIAQQMTPADVSRAQQMATECLKKNYKGC